TNTTINPITDLGVSNTTPGTYTYYAVCESNTGCGARVPATFTVNPRPTGTASGGGTVCVSDALPNVTFNFTGTPPYDFEYSGPSGNIPVLGHNSNSFTITNAAAGTYSLSTLNDQLCSATSLGGNVSVNVVQLPNAGTDNTLVTTSTSLPTNMLSLLGPNAQVGGSWSGPSPVVGDLYDPATMDEGVYTYTKNADAPCSGSDEATIEVSEVPITALVLEFVMPSFGMLPTWELREVGTDALAASGGGNFVPFAGIHVNNTGVPPGNFYLTFPGSVAPATKYTLRTAGNPGIRLIENVAAAGTAHQVAEFAVTPPAPSTEGTVQIPVGPTELLFTSCDKYFWKKGEFIVVNEDPDVAAVWIPGAGTNQSSTTGYDFWFYDPNGTYSFMRQRRHNETDGFGNVGSARTCHMQVNHWAAANWIPNQLPLNVRVRAVVENVPKNWGPACRFVRDDVLATCTPTWLMDVPGNPFISCNVIRAFNNQSINRVYARPVSGATKYKFIFTTSEGTIEREVSTYYLTLGWNASVAPPLEDEVVYDVTVQAFKGGSYCTLGQSCTVQICNTPGSCTNDFSGGQQHSAIDAPDAEAALTLYPNPNRGDQLTVALTAVSEGVNTVNVDLYDLSGKRMIARTIAAQDGFVNTVLDLNNELAAGMYMVQITAGDQVYTQRLVIQP
ncbi:MAG: T9SS type A sorting domain-containing protein, partial [Flavobacteriales bacterium]